MPLVAIASLCLSFGRAAAEASASPIARGDALSLEVLDPIDEFERADLGPPTFFIRGIGVADIRNDFTTGVTVVRDGTPVDLPAMQMLGFHDLAPVEIERGPRAGSEYGATAGVVRLRAAAPQPEFAGSLRASIGNFEARDYEAMLNLPLLDDRILARFSSRFQDRDGLYQNGCGGAPPLGARPPSPVSTNRSVSGVLKNTCGEDDPTIVPADLANEPYDRHLWSGRAQLRALPEFGGVEFDITAGGELEFRHQGDVVPALIPSGGNPTVTNPDPTSPFPLAGFLGTGNYLPVEINREYNRLRDFARANLVPPGTPQREARTNDFVIPVLNHTLGKRGDQRPYDIDINRDTRIDQNSWSVFVRTQAELGPQFRLQTTHSYRDYLRRRMNDEDGSPNSVDETMRSDNAHQHFHEIALSGEGEGAERGQRDGASGAWSWRIGAQYLGAAGDRDEFQFLTGASQSFFSVARSRFDLDAFALHGAGALAIGALELQGSLRFDHYERWESRDALFRVISAQPARGATHTKQGEVSGHLEIAGRLASNAKLYARYTRAVHGPQSQLDDGVQATPEQVLDPERVDAVELGVRGALLGDRLRLSGAFFYHDIRDRQLAFEEPGLFGIPILVHSTAEQAESYGAELAILAEPVDGLRIATRFEWLEATIQRYARAQYVYTSVEIAPGVVAPVLEFVGIRDRSDARAPNSPRFRVELAVEGDLEMGRFGSLHPRYEMNWRDDVVFDVFGGRGPGSVSLGQANWPELTIGQKDVVLHNLRLAYRFPVPRVDLELAFWARNVTNEVYRTGGHSAEAAGNGAVLFLGEPRTFGGEATLAW